MSTTLSSFGGTAGEATINPTFLDAGLKNDRTQEFVVGLQQELMRNLAVEVNYVWRKYDQFTWTDRTNWDTSNFVPVTLAPTNCGPTAICDPVTYYRATSGQPSAYVRRNQPDRYRDYNGVELALNKRYSDRWAANVSFAWNNMALAELRDLNRHRTGHRYTPLIQAGFYLPPEIDRAPHAALLADQLEFTRELMKRGSPAWPLPGRQSS